MTLRRTSVLALALAASFLAAAFLATSAGALTLQSQSYQLNGADTKQRLTVRCPGKKALPYSGGMYTDPLGADGEGIYPHSYEGLESSAAGTSPRFSTRPPHSGAPVVRSPCRSSAGRGSAR